MARKKDTSDKRVNEIVGYALLHGDAKAVKDLGVSHETIARYRRLYNEREGGLDGMKLLKEVAEKFSEAELKAMVKSADGQQVTRTKLDLPAVESITFGVISDTHIGSQDFCPELLDYAFDCFVQHDVDLVVHPGDIMEGMSNRSGHIYTLDPEGIGVDAQIDLSVKYLSQWTNTPMYLLGGNHGEWAKNDVGVNAEKHVADRIPNAEYVGMHEASLWFGDMEVRLWHGKDGAAYTKSYRLQQIIRSLTEDDLPHVLIAGHDHKRGAWEDRGVELVAAGACSYQSMWMRTTRKSHDAGFYVVNIEWDGEMVRSILPRWFNAPRRRRSNGGFSIGTD